MPPPPEQSLDEWRRFVTRPHDNAQDVSPPLGSKGRIDSSDIRESGALFSGVLESYPTQLEWEEGEKVDNDTDTPSSSPSTEAGASSNKNNGMPSPGGRPTLLPPSTPHVSPLVSYLRSHPYLDPAEIPELRRWREDRSRRSRRSHSSARTTSSSEYLSAKNYRSWSDSNTEATQEDLDHPDGAEGDGEDAPHHILERQLTPYFTPSHTPSHRSEETAEYAELEGREPESPHPRSNFYPYDERYGIVAVEVAERGLDSRVL